MNSTPILVLAYTNHALDQFLCHSLDYTKNIIRVGGRCTEEKLKDYMLSNLKKNIKYPHYFGHIFRESKSQIELSNNQIDNLKSRLENKYVNLKGFLSKFPKYYCTKFENELLGLLNHFEINLKQTLHPSSLDILFKAWLDNIDNNESLKQIIDQIVSNEKNYKNFLHETSWNRSQWSQIPKQEEEVRDEDSEEDIYFMENKNIENDQFGLGFDFSAHQKKDNYDFFYNSISDEEILLETDYFIGKNIWDLTSCERQCLCSFPFSNCNSQKDINLNLNDFYLILNQKKNFFIQRDISLLKEADIVGMTVIFS